MNESATEYPAPRRTPLYAEHERLGATFTDFGGWEMPLKYGSELAEHRAVRETAGLFDLSHMGEIWVEGPDAARFLNSTLVGDLAAVRVGRAKYSLLCTEQGGIVDDLICYRLADDRYLVVPNAGNAATVVARLAERSADFDVKLRDATAATSLIAVQGPRSVEIVREVVTAADRDRVAQLRYYAATQAEIAGVGGAGGDADTVTGLVARTGYTGEDGFELYVPNECAAELWPRLLAAGEAHGLTPAGLAARDSLRLEAGMPLYGNELSEATQPFAAGLGAIVSFSKTEDFVGRAALEAARTHEPERVLVGLKGLGRRAGRGGYAVYAASAAVSAAASADLDRQIGVITSGQPSPTLGYPIALAFVEPAFAALGTALEIDLRGRREAVEVTELPFYRRG